MGVLNLMLGVVCNVFTIARDRIIAEMEDEKRVQRLETEKHLLSMCNSLDLDGDGLLTREELEIGYRDKEDFRDTVNSLDVSDTDLDMIWSILDNDKTGTVETHEFVSQIYKMKSSDSDFMLFYIKYYITVVKDSILQVLEKEEQTMKDTQDILRRNMTLIEQEEEQIHNHMETLKKQVSHGLEDDLPHDAPELVHTNNAQTHSQESAVLSGPKGCVNDCNAGAVGKSSNSPADISDRVNDSAVHERVL